MDETTTIPRETLLKLQGLPASSELQAAVDRLKARRDAGLGMFAQARALADAHALLRDAEERDRLQSVRPAGCICLGTGSLRDGGFCSCPEGIAAQADLERRMAARRKQDVASYQARAFIPARNRDHTIATYPGTIPDDVRDWTGAEGRGLFLGGPTGRGKTGLAVSLMRRWIESNCQSALFVVVPELLDNLRDTYRKDSDASEGEYLRHIRKVPMLVLDDLATEKSSEWVEEKLYLLINHRYGAMLPTIYTSNLSLKELGEKWHERIAWRIQESATVVHLAGKNLRAAQ
jgi:hypothetical protein